MRMALFIVTIGTMSIYDKTLVNTSLPYNLERDPVQVNSLLGCALYYILESRWRLACEGYQPDVMVIGCPEIAQVVGGRLPRSLLLPQAIKYSSTCIIKQVGLYANNRPTSSFSDLKLLNSNIQEFYGWYII